VTTTLDNRFDAAKGPRWGELTEEQLLKREFTVSDPESLEGVSDDPPPDGEPEVFDLRPKGCHDSIASRGLSLPEAHVA
jgi:hypothetical protein